MGEVPTATPETTTLELEALGPQELQKINQALGWLDSMPVCDDEILGLLHRDRGFKSELRMNCVDGLVSVRTDRYSDGSVISVTNYPARSVKLFPNSGRIEFVGEEESLVCENKGLTITRTKSNNLGTICCHLSSRGQA